MRGGRFRFMAVWMVPVTCLSIVSVLRACPDKKFGMGSTRPSVTVEVAERVVWRFCPDDCLLPTDDAP